MNLQSALPRYIFIGQLQREFTILSDGRILLDQPGGNLIYAAVGLAVWEPEPPPGLVTRVGEDFPSEWIKEFNHKGFNTQGIRILPEAVDLRSFSVFTDKVTHRSEDPVPHFARLGQPFPRMLLGYRPSKNVIDSRTRLLPNSVRQADVPEDYLDATAAHLCPIDFLTHSLMPAVLRQAGFTTVTLDPSPGMMNPAFWDDVPSIITGLTAFLPSEEDLVELFRGRSSDLWEMAEILASFGCEFVIIKRGVGGQFLFDAHTHSRWEVPAYPARIIDAIGVGDAFCGGFLAGYRRTFDPLEAVLYGNISASLAIEGSGPFFALEALPGLAQARLEALRDSVRKLS